MKIKLKKILVMIVAVMTLGFYVPPLNLDINAEAENRKTESDKKNDDTSDSLVYDTSVYLDDLSDPEIYEPDPAEVLLDQAKNYIIEKLGSKIAIELEEDLSENILPNVELVVADLIEMKGADQIVDLSIIESQVTGYGEKIFDLYDGESNQIIAKFHVRRENRPQDGYWFNFHYHLADDQFEAHYGIAEVYWSKDTPPKWRS